jgi:hypothetical protein
LRRETEGAEVIPYRAIGLGDRPIAGLIAGADGAGAAAQTDAGHGDGPAAGGEGSPA